jgi:3-deoxy-D-manno-octulosonic-acid transferase
VPNYLLLRFYFVLYACLIPLAQLYAKFNHKFGKQMRGRRPNAEQLAKLRAARQKFNKRVIFFASSAGEFEQALPLVHRLESEGTFTHTFFFSNSGFDYAKARNFAFSCSKAPLDLPRYWRPLLNEISPMASFVIRYELWPGFLFCANEYGPLYLVNASQSHRGLDAIKRSLLKFFKIIFFTNNDSLVEEISHVQATVVKIVGDTKYDRVLERATTNSQQIAELREKIIQSYGDRKVVVLGSCWPKDVEIFLSGWQQLSSNEQNQVALIFAPHDVTQEHIKHIEQQILAVKSDYIRFSRWMNDPSLAHGGTAMVIDTVGKLAEVYGAATCAMVGGAMHHKVHNVLEPAAHKLAICFGPRFESQREASLFVENGIATVVSNGEDVALWLRSLIYGQNKSGEAAWQQVKDLAGATDKILGSLPELYR